MKNDKNDIFECWRTAEMVMPHCRRILLAGPPGTGKTRAACSVSKDVINITLTEETPAAELRGHYIPKGNEFVWMDGPGTVAWRTGRAICLNEINRASADTMSYLLAFLDDPELAYMTLPSGETIRPLDGFRVIATMNGEANDLPPALEDRFPVKILIDRPHPGAVARLPQHLQSAAIEGVLLPEERRTSIRAWLAFVELSENVGDDLAAKAVFGDRGGDLLQAIKIAKAGK